MKHKTILFFLCIWFAVTTAVAMGGDKPKPAKPVASKSTGSATDTPVGSYRIGPGDVLDISVWKDEALSKIVTVLPDGMFSFPLIGEIKAQGRTVAGIKIELEKKISRFVPNPDISVVVSQVNSMQVYVIGRVTRPNRFLLNTNINVLQALSMAGGLTPYAKRDKIKVFRNENGKTAIFRFDYDEVTKDEKLEQNIELKRGDVIVVP